MSPHIDKARILINSQRYEMARTELLDELAENPQNSTAYSLLALCLSGLKKDTEAMQAVMSGISINPDESYGYYIRAILFYRLNKPIQAEKSIKQALELNSYDPRYFSLLGDVKFLQKNWEATIKAAEAGLNLNPEYITCINLKAMALIKLNRYEEAKTDILTALKNSPEDSFTHANYGWFLLQTGKRNEATEHFREALKLNPTSDWAKLGFSESYRAENVLYYYILRFSFLINRVLENPHVKRKFIIFGIMTGIFSSLLGVNYLLVYFLISFLYLFLITNLILKVFLRIKKRVKNKN